MLDRFKVSDFGPIFDADVTLDDLTILIGTQASGKNLFLVLFNLVKDYAPILSTLKKHNYILDKTPAFSLTEYHVL